jgi:hypothetical protein
MQLMTEQSDGIFTPNPTFYYYQIMAGYLDSAESVVKVETDSPDIYLFEVTRYDDGKLYVVWEKRDQFSGEDEPPIDFTFRVPWQSVYSCELFGSQAIIPVINGDLTIAITDTPIFIQEHFDSE